MSTDIACESVLWIAPNLNHYKKQALNRLAMRGLFKISVLSGKAAIGVGHDESEIPTAYNTQEITVPRRRFGFSPYVFARIFKQIKAERPNIVLMPVERKLLPLILWTKLLRPLFRFKLVSYNHPVLRASRLEITERDLSRTRKYFSLYNQIIFYTEGAKDWAVKTKLLDANKAFHANNTIATDIIQDVHNHEASPLTPPHILFIGRLIDSKRIDLLLRYFEALKAQSPNAKLTIIGSGPRADLIEASLPKDSSIHYLGPITDEAKIAPHMAAANLVFIPGESGLSIAHAFAYAKPYATLNLATSRHGPEISYLKDNKNGLMLTGEIDIDIPRLMTFFSNQDTYADFCRAARASGESLSIQNWCAQIETAFLAVLDKPSHPSLPR